MDSIRYIYRIGCGPSSSHTMAPRRAAQEFLSLTPDASAYRVTLYGSLAATGRGHLTDTAITDVLSKAAPVAIEWRPQEVLPEHPNGMKFEAIGDDNAVMRSWTTFSVGGGALSDDVNDGVALYDKSTIHDILEWCQTEGYSFWEYVERCEGSGIWEYLAEVWRVMQEAIKRGLDAEGVLPGGLGVRRKAGDYYIHAHNSVKQLYNRGLMYSFALAVIEENASGGTIVTAPTCGSCGVLPAVLYYMKEQFHLPDSHWLQPVCLVM